MRGWYAVADVCNDPFGFVIECTTKFPHVYVCAYACVSGHNVSVLDSKTSTAVSTIDLWCAWHHLSKHASQSSRNLHHNSRLCLLLQSLVLESPSVSFCTRRRSTPSCEWRSSSGAPRRQRQQARCESERTPAQWIYIAVDTYC